MTIGEFKPDTYAVDVTLSGHLVLSKKIVYSISSAIVCKVVSFVIIFNMKGMYHGIHLSPTIMQNVVNGHGVSDFTVIFREDGKLLSVCHKTILFTYFKH